MSEPPPYPLPKKWQVFFLPKRELDENAQVVAYCPHTGVEGIGKNIEEAKSNWIQNAEEKYKGKKFLIKQIKRERVWSGANERVLQSSNEEVPVYVLPSQSEYVALCPETKETISGKYEEWQELDAKRSKQTEFLPSTWVDQPVACSPLSDFEKSWY